MPWVNEKTSDSAMALPAFTGFPSCILFKSILYIINFKDIDILVLYKQNNYYTIVWYFLISVCDYQRTIVLCSSSNPILAEAAHQNCKQAMDE